MKLLRIKYLLVYPRSYKLRSTFRELSAVLSFATYLERQGTWQVFLRSLEWGKSLPLKGSLSPSSSYQFVRRCSGSGPEVKAAVTLKIESIALTKLIRNH